MLTGSSRTADYLPCRELPVSTSWKETLEDERRSDIRALVITYTTLGFPY